MSTNILAKSPRKKAAVNPRWEQWQHSTISEQLLSEKDRRAGYAVTRVLPACQDLFLDIATLLLTYGDLVHKHHTFSLDTQEALARWYQAMQALTQALAKERHG
jgi:hypothetical protein